MNLRRISLLDGAVEKGKPVFDVSAEERDNECLSLHL